MAKVAVTNVTNVMESLLNRYPAHNKSKDLVISAGKGKGSDATRGPVLLPVVLDLLETEYDVRGEVEEDNTGRIRVPSAQICDFTEKRAWISSSSEEDSV